MDTEEHGHDLWAKQQKLSEVCGRVFRVDPISFQRASEKLHIETKKNKQKTKKLNKNWLKFILK